MIKVLADVIYETPAPTRPPVTTAAMVDTPMDVIVVPPIEAWLGSHWVIWLIAILVGVLAIGTVILIRVLNKRKKKG
ncbi:MAG: hypothetical protein GX681_07605 [Clostridiaceae bacterium]|jgi:hypothetical protein|nr:hypothetical protein [Clostridiaceae bacterium]